MESRKSLQVYIYLIKECNKTFNDVDIAESYCYCYNNFYWRGVLRITRLLQC